MAARDLERVLWAWLKRGVPLLAGRKHVQRIEDTTKTGTPDVEGCINGGSFWCELKVAHEQRTKGTIRIPHFTARQAFFLLRRAEAGGRAWLLIRVGQHPTMGHYLVPGALCEELLDRPITLVRLRELSTIDPGSPAERVLLACAHD